MSAREDNTTLLSFLVLLLLLLLLLLDDSGAGLLFSSLGVCMDSDMMEQVGLGWTKTSEHH